MMHFPVQMARIDCQKSQSKKMPRVALHRFLGIFKDPQGQEQEKRPSKNGL
jgi:flagellar biosynthesis regulator FlbT